MGIFNCKDIDKEEQFSKTLCINRKRKEKKCGQHNKDLLSGLERNSQAIITGYDTALDVKSKRRMLELGFITGKKISVEQISILGDVLLIEINGYLLSLRADIAKHIFVKQISKRESL